MARNIFASRIVFPAGLAFAALALVASPVGFGKAGLSIQSARAETSIDKLSVDPVNHDSTSVDPNGTSGSNDVASNSNDAKSGTSSGGDAGTNGSSHDSNSGGSNGGSGGGSGGGKDGGSDH